MTQAEMNREVATATGESVSTISNMGFVPLTPVPYGRCACEGSKKGLFLAYVA